MSEHVSESTCQRVLSKEVEQHRLEHVSEGADGVNRSQLWGNRTSGELKPNWAAYLTLVSAVLTLSMSAKCWAPLGPKSFKSTLKTNGDLVSGATDGVNGSQSGPRGRF